MGKHLSVEEKLNAPKEMDRIKAKLPQLRRERGQLKYLLARKYSDPVRADYEARLEQINQEMKDLKLKKLKLEYFLCNVKNSPYGGNFYKESVCHKVFGKKRSELSQEEARIYDRVMRELRIARGKKNAKKK